MSIKSKKLIKRNQVTEVYILKNLGIKIRNKGSILFIWLRKKK
jgi:hypothetical protein